MRMGSSRGAVQLLRGRCSVLVGQTTKHLKLTWFINVILYTPLAQLTAALAWALGTVPQGAHRQGHMSIQNLISQNPRVLTHENNTICSIACMKPINLINRYSSFKCLMCFPLQGFSSFGGRLGFDACRIGLDSTQSVYVTNSIIIQGMNTLKLITCCSTQSQNENLIWHESGSSFVTIFARQ